MDLSEMKEMKELCYFVSLLRPVLRAACCDCSISIHATRILEFIFAIRTFLHSSTVRWTGTLSAPSIDFRGQNAKREKEISICFIFHKWILNFLTVSQVPMSQNGERRAKDGKMTQEWRWRWREFVLKKRLASILATWTELHIYVS